MSSSEPVELVMLQPGCYVPLVALQLLWRLEDAGFRIDLTVDGRLRIGPRSRLTTADDQSIRQHRDVLVALVRHCETVQ
ncbi:MAG: hypothetical protein M3451_09640 [Chloroflexota bacterium]|nr:hypothetical protein [Acidobacteriota bacterium]MDQ3525302.1 hypothetical protein [Chloroflexota bacterium]